ncbi:Gfo/Idh/MocA family oxidoreductase [Arenicella sp. 4NH20-0111]|uniref:Gfo/Idh/MocA family protein n=1 Tax=Arenicella sp. 4NH20-0111 TaxID=3127648 RepID=UPI003107511D
MTIDGLTNWGVIAPGKIAEKFSKALQGTNNANCYAVASRNPSKAARFANEHGFNRVHDSYQELASDPLVDVIYIASPHNLHATQTIMCLNAGKPVICEKPLSVNLKEAQSVITAASQNNVFYMEAVWTRFLPVYNDIRRWIDEGKIGEVQMIDASFGFAMGYDSNHRINNPKLAGGSLLDLGIYPITFADWIMDAHPNSISSVAKIGPTGVDDKNAIQLSYSNGVIATLKSSSTTILTNQAWILGDKGRIEVPDFWSAESAILTESNGQKTIASHTHDINGYEGEIGEVQRCLDLDLLESPIMSHTHSLRVIGIMDEVRRQIGLSYPFE